MVQLPISIESIRGDLPLGSGELSPAQRRRLARQRVLRALEQGTRTTGTARALEPQRQSPEKTAIEKIEEGATNLREFTKEERQAIINNPQLQRRLQQESRRQQFQGRDVLIVSPTGRPITYTTERGAGVILRGLEEERTGRQQQANDLPFMPGLGGRALIESAAQQARSNQIITSGTYQVNEGSIIPGEEPQQLPQVRPFRIQTAIERGSDYLSGLSLRLEDTSLTAQREGRPLTAQISGIGSLGVGVGSGLLFVTARPVERIITPIVTGPIYLFRGASGEGFPQAGEALRQRPGSTIGRFLGEQVPFFTIERVFSRSVEGARIRRSLQLEVYTNEAGEITRSRGRGFVVDESVTGIGVRGRLIDVNTGVTLREFPFQGRAYNVDITRPIQRPGPRVLGRDIITDDFLTVGQTEIQLRRITNRETISARGSSVVISRPISNVRGQDLFISRGEYQFGTETGRGFVSRRGRISVIAPSEPVTTVIEPSGFESQTFVFAGETTFTGFERNNIFRQLPRENTFDIYTGSSRRVAEFQLRSEPVRFNRLFSRGARLSDITPDFGIDPVREVYRLQVSRRAGPSFIGEFSRRFGTTTEAARSFRTERFPRPERIRVLEGGTTQVEQALFPSPVRPTQISPVVRSLAESNIIKELRSTGIFRFETPISLRVGQPIRQTSTTRQTSIPRQTSTTRQTSIPRQVSIPRQTQIPRQVSIPRQVTVPRQISIPRQTSIPRQVQTPREIQIPRQVSIPRQVQTPREILPYYPPPDTPRRIRTSTQDDRATIRDGAFNVFVKEKKQFIKVNKQPLTRQDALSLGGRVTDETTARSFKITPTIGKATPRNDPYFEINMSKFRPQIRRRSQAADNNYWVERSRYAIDTQGEFRGITVKGWLAQRRRRR